MCKWRSLSVTTWKAEQGLCEWRHAFLFVRLTSEAGHFLQGNTSRVRLIDWLINWRFTPYRQNFNHIKRRVHTRSITWYFVYMKWNWNCQVLFYLQMRLNILTPTLYSVLFSVKLHVLKLNKEKIWWEFCLKESIL